MVAYEQPADQGPADVGELRSAQFNIDRPKHHVASAAAVEIRRVTHMQVDVREVAIAGVAATPEKSTAYHWCSRAMW